jgi:putative protein-disulfide isomerase
MGPAWRDHVMPHDQRIALLRGQPFGAAYDAQAGAPTQAHIAQSRALLARLGGQGFPTLALQRGSQWQLLPTGQFLGQPQAFAAFLRG